MGWASWYLEGACMKYYYYSYVVSSGWGALSRAMRHKSLYSNICINICMGPGFPGAQAHGWGRWSINWQLAAIAMPPTQDFGKLLPSQLYRQTHNLLIIHLIFLARGMWWGARGVSLHGKSRVGPLDPRFNTRIDFDEMRTRWWSYSHCLLIMLTHSAYS